MPVLAYGEVYAFALSVYLMMGSIMPGINPDFGDVIIPGLVTFAIVAVTLLGLLVLVPYLAGSFLV